MLSRAPDQMSVPECGRQSDVPFRRWKAAISAFDLAERVNPYDPRIERLAATVIAARIELIRARVADGWVPREAVLCQLDADLLLVEESDGAMSE